MDRSNDEWMEHLTGADPVRLTAVADLRSVLLRGLRRGLASHPHADDALLEDVAQDALLCILERLPQFEGRSRFVTWAVAIAIHAGLSELRRRRWQDVSLDEIASDAELAARPVVDDGPGPEERSARRAILDALFDLIHRELTERQRTALLAELKGMPLEEIARQLNSNRNAVYKLTHDARKRLKRALEAAGYRAEDIHAAFAS